MDPSVVLETTVETQPLDFSLWALMLRADPVVQAVLLLLAAASVWSWAIIFEKSFRIRRAHRKADQFERDFWSGLSLDDLYQQIGHRPGHPLASLFSAAMREWRRTIDSGNVHFTSLSERINKVMAVTINREMTRLERQLLFLATVGSTAPFVGLFGTVWGIMNSFQAIAVSRDTNLTVVAPGIAEALFATAIGLLAAIPAVVAYNKFTNDLGRYAGRLEGFADEFGAILSRQMDEQR